MSAKPLLMGKSLVVAGKGATGRRKAISLYTNPKTKIPIQLAVKRGKTVILLQPDGNLSRSLEASATSVLHIHDTHLRNAQFPDVIQLDNGKVIKKPDSF